MGLRSMIITSMAPRKARHAAFFVDVLVLCMVTSLWSRGTKVMHRLWFGKSLIKLVVPVQALLRLRAGRV